jgi:hypothetical protein
MPSGATMQWFACAPKLLHAFKAELLGLAGETSQQEVRCI